MAKHIYALICQIYIPIFQNSSSLPFSQSLDFDRFLNIDFASI